jgi:cell division protein FtsB
MKNINKFLRNNIIFVAVMFVCVVIIQSRISMFPDIIAANAALEEKQQALDAQIAQAQSTLAVIEDANRKSESARAQYHLSEEGELIFIFPEETIDE